MLLCFFLLQHPIKSFGLIRWGSFSQSKHLNKQWHLNKDLLLDFPDLTLWKIDPAELKINEPCLGSMVTLNYFEKNLNISASCSMLNIKVKSATLPSFIKEYGLLGIDILESHFQNDIIFLKIKNGNKILVQYLKPSKDNVAVTITCPLELKNQCAILIKQIKYNPTTLAKDSFYE